MLTSVIHRWKDIIPLYCGEIVKPHFVDFHTSNVCNHNCKGCAFKHIIQNQFLSEDAHFEAVDMFIDHGVAAFDFAGGGEPCMMPYLGDLFTHIRQRNAYYGLITNGSIMDEDFIQTLIDGATYVRISLEASRAEDYAKYKAVDLAMWDRVIHNIGRLIEAKKRKKSQSQISLKFSVGRSLRGKYHYNRIITLANMLDVDRVYVKALRHEPEELAADYRRAEENDLREMLAAPENVEIAKKFYIGIAPSEIHDVPQCYLNPLHTTMDHEGNIYLCCYYYYRPEDHYIGNIFTDDFEKIWFSKMHKEKIKAISRKECAKVDCKFFAHHKAVEESMKGGRVYFL